MEGVREFREKEVRMLLELPEFRSAVEGIRHRLNPSLENLRDRVRVFVCSDGTVSYFHLDKALRRINADTVPGWFQVQIQDLLKKYSLRSWWYEEWLVRYTLFDEQPIPANAYTLVSRPGPTGQEELYVWVDLAIPGVDGALRELCRKVNAYHGWIAGPEMQRLRSTPNFERDLAWWVRIRVLGQSPEAISAESEERDGKDWDREIETLKGKGMKEADAHAQLGMKWTRMGRSREPLDPDAVRRAVERLDERYRGLFKIDPRDLGQTTGDT